MENKIREVIEKDINPGLASHGGGCELLSYKNGVVTVRLSGGCAGCPGRQMTLLNGIAPILKKKVPEVKEIILG